MRSVSDRRRGGVAEKVRGCRTVVAVLVMRSKLLQANCCANKHASDRGNAIFWTLLRKQYQGGAHAMEQATGASLAPRGRVTDVMV